VDYVAKLVAFYIKNNLQSKTDQERAQKTGSYVLLIIFLLNFQRYAGQKTKADEQAAGQLAYA
jgi:hypothetical protein